MPISNAIGKKANHLINYNLQKNIKNQLQSIKIIKGRCLRVFKTMQASSQTLVSSYYKKIDDISR